jgi:hypothetical protein
MRCGTVRGEPTGCAATPSPDGGCATRAACAELPPRDLLKALGQGRLAERRPSKRGGDKPVLPEGKGLLIGAAAGTLDGRAQLAEGRLFRMLTKGEDG